MERVLTANQKLWIEALRSGLYEQSGHALEPYPQKYCCLGVACKVAEAHGVPVNYSEGKLLGGNLLVQEDVMNWLNLKTPDGLVDPSDSTSTAITAMNDILQKSFADIADFIETGEHNLFEEPK